MSKQTDTNPQQDGYILSEDFDWGVFVEDTHGRTFEVRLPDDLAEAVSQYLLYPEQVKLIQETHGKIIW
jgi:hypothetical protein